MRENKKAWAVGIAGVSVVATMLSGVAIPSSPAEASGSSLGARTTQRWSGAINTMNRDAVNYAYKTRYAAKLNQPISWLNGSVRSCLPGLLGGSSNAGTLAALNFVRSMAGLGPVTFSPSLNAQAQRAALIMDANDALNHSPGRNWRCWSQTGATTAGRSNLALSWPELRSGQIVDLYMDDRGASNIDAGHRRWLLYPFTTVMGSGSTTTANALTVIGPTSALRPNPTWVGWPTAGWFPTTMEPDGRWSLSSGLSSVSFRTAKVQVYRNGKRVGLKRHPVHNGYGQPTIVWDMASNVPMTGIFTVVVYDIRKPGVRPYSHKYQIRMFKPY